MTADRAPGKALKGPHEIAIVGTLVNDPTFEPTKSGNGEVALMKLEVKIPGREAFSFAKNGVETTIPATPEKSHWHFVRLVGKNIEDARDLHAGDIVKGIGSVESHNRRDSNQKVIGVTLFEVSKDVTPADLARPNQVHLAGEIMASKYRPNRGNPELDSIDYTLKTFGKNGTEIAVREFGTEAQQKFEAGERSVGQRVEVDGRLSVVTYPKSNGERGQSWSIATTHKEVEFALTRAQQLALEQAQQPQAQQPQAQQPQAREQRIQEIEAALRSLERDEDFVDRRRENDPFGPNEAEIADSYAEIASRREALEAELKAARESEQPDRDGRTEAKSKHTAVERTDGKYDLYTGHYDNVTRATRDGVYEGTATLAEIEANTAADVAIMRTSEREAQLERAWIAGRARGLEASGIDPIEASKQAMLESQQREKAEHERPQEPDLTVTGAVTQEQLEAALAEYEAQQAARENTPANTEELSDEQVDALYAEYEATRLALTAETRANAPEPMSKRISPSMEERLEAAVAEAKFAAAHGEEYLENLRETANEIVTRTDELPTVPVVAGFVHVAEASVDAYIWSLKDPADVPDRLEEIPRDQQVALAAQATAELAVTPAPLELTDAQRAGIIESIKTNAYEMSVSPRQLPVLANGALLDEYLASGAGVTDRIAVIGDRNGLARGAERGAEYDATSDRLDRNDDGLEMDDEAFEPELENSLGYGG